MRPNNIVFVWCICGHTVACPYMGCYLFFCSFVKKYLFLYIVVQLRRLFFPVGKKYFSSRGHISTQLGKFHMPVFGAMPFCKVCLFRFLRTHCDASLLIVYPSNSPLSGRRGVRKDGVVGYCFPDAARNVPTNMILRS